MYLQLPNADRTSRQLTVFVYITCLSRFFKADRRWQVFHFPCSVIPKKIELIKINTTRKAMILRIKQMLIKEFLQMFRDPRMRLVVFVMPLIQLAVLSFALTTDVKNIALAVVDPDNTPESREFVSRFSASGYFRPKAVLHDKKSMARLLDEGKVRAVLVLPHDFTDKIRAGRQTDIQLLVDGTLSNDAAITFNYASRVLDQYNRDINPALANLPMPVAARAWYNPNLESKYYYVPGLIAVMLILIGLMLTSMAIVREKEIGTIEQVMVTPIRRLEFILGKTTPFLITGFFTMTLMFAIARILFGITVNGSHALLYLATGIYMCGNLGLALLVSVTARTQQQALLTAFLFLVPLVLLSGFIFPIHNMPEAVRMLTLLNPMRWYLDLVRGIVVKGVGLNQLWPPILAQTALAAGFLSLAVLKFKKTLK